MTRLLTDVEMVLFDKHRATALRWASTYRKKLPPHVDTDDLRQDALIGLARASRTYDPERGVFASYAYRHVMGAIVDGLRARDWVPRSVKPDDRAVTISLDAEHGNHETTLYHQLTDNRSLDPALAALADERDQELRAQVMHLPPRERYVVIAYHWGEQTMTEIGRSLGITESRVSQLHTKAMLRLRPTMKRHAA